MRKLEVLSVAKPWGREDLPEPFAKTGEKIGEIWFRPDPAMSSLLVKYIFTSEPLSIQVHPSDAQTERANLGRQGKEECWLVLHAEPGSTLEIGLDRELDSNAAERAISDGSIVGALKRHSVKKGDFFYIPANTIHAIGAGIILLEIQQNSDITYRLYDYGRSRELHVKEGLNVSLFEPYPYENYSALSENTILGIVNGPHFLIDQVRGALTPEVIRRHSNTQVMIVPQRGTVRSNGSVLSFGECGIVEDIATCLADEDDRYLIVRPF